MDDLVDDVNPGQEEQLVLGFDMMFMIAVMVYQADLIRTASKTNDPEQIAKGISALIEQMEIMDQSGFVQDMIQFRREVLNDKFK